MLPGPVVRKLDSAIHRIVIVSSVVNIPENNEIIDLELAIIKKNHKFKNTMV